MRHPIARARQQKQLNCTELAHAVQCLPAEISQWEDGQGHPPAPVAVRMARVLQLSLVDIYSSLIEAEERAGRLSPRRLHHRQVVRQLRHGPRTSVPGPDHGAPLEVLR